MDGKIVDLTEYARHVSESCDQGEGIEPDDAIVPWLVQAAFRVTTAHFSDPSTASVHLVIDLDPLHQRWEVDLWREGWRHIGTLRGEDREVLTFLNDLLCASFGSE